MEWKKNNPHCSAFWMLIPWHSFKNFSFIKAPCWFMVCTLPLPPIPALTPDNTKQLEFSLGIIPTVFLCEVSGVSFMAFLWHSATTPLPIAVAKALQDLFYILHCSPFQNWLIVSTCCESWMCYFSFAVSLPVCLRYTVFLIYSLMEGFLGYNLKHLFLILLNILDM